MPDADAGLFDSMADADAEAFVIVGVAAKPASGFEADSVVGVVSAEPASGFEADSLAARIEQVRLALGLAPEPLPAVVDKAAAVLSLFDELKGERFVAKAAACYAALFKAAAVGQKDTTLAASTSSWDLSGAVPFVLSARVRTTQASGTILAKAFPDGRWRNGGGAGQAKLLFLRGGRVCFDIGWVGSITGSTQVNDGDWHDVALRFNAALGVYQVLLDGAVDGAGLNAMSDHPDLCVYSRIPVGHRVSDGVANGDMASRFEGDIEDLTYESARHAAAFSMVQGHASVWVSQNYSARKWKIVSDETVKIEEGAGSAFRVVPGLTGEKGTVSFEDAARPGRYLRHAGYAMRCHSSSHGGPFALDATFRPRPALTGEPGFVSYESVNFPSRYISHRGFHLRIEHAEDSTLHRNDASFRIETSARY